MATTKSNYFTTVYVLGAVLSFGQLVLAQTSCEPAREGTPYTITCRTKIQNIVSLEWRRSSDQANGTFSLVSNCSTSSDSSCNDLEPSKYTAVIQDMPSGATSAITILNVSLTDSETTWRCIIGDLTLEECMVTVFTPPTDVTCATPVLTDSSSIVFLSCVTPRVYPRAICEFYSNSSQGSALDGVISYLHQTADSSSNYIQSECIVKFPVADMEAGAIQFRVLMYPDVRDGRDFNVFSNYTSTLSFEIPIAVIDPLCPVGSHVKDDYIMSGTEAACRCQIQNHGFPPGFAEWFDSNDTKTGSHVVDGNVVASQLNFSFHPDTATLKYTCRGVSNLGRQEPGESITPKFAYGPNTMNIKLSSTVYDICPSNTDYVVVVCEVPIPDFNINPSPLFTILANETVLRSEQYGIVNPGVNHSYSYQYKPSLSGIQNMICKAKNLKFSELSAENSQELIVREPPKSPPLIRINSKLATAMNNSFVVNGEASDVSCETQGGFPEVSKLQLTCGVEVTVTNGSFLTTEVYFTRDMVDDSGGIPCSCMAWHVTGCYYDNITTITVFVSYQVSLANFTANSEKDQLVLSPGDNVSFVCDADGDPLPTISIARERMKSIVKTVNQTDTLSLVIPSIHCVDMDTYICEADNGILSTEAHARKNIDVFVKCAFKLNNSDDNNQNYSAAVGQDISVSLDVLGYPPPTSVSLTTISGVEVEPNKYNVTMSYIKVILVLLNVREESFTKYILRLDNGVEGPFSFYFGLESKASCTDCLEPDNEESDKTLEIGLGVGFGVLLLLILITFCICYRRRKQASAQEGRATQQADTASSQQRIVDLLDGQEGRATQLADTASSQQRIVDGLDDDDHSAASESHLTTSGSYIEMHIAAQDAGIYDEPDFSTSTPSHLLEPQPERNISTHTRNDLRDYMNTSLISQRGDYLEPGDDPRHLLPPQQSNISSNARHDLEGGYEEPDEISRVPSHLPEPHPWRNISTKTNEQGSYIEPDDVSRTLLHLPKPHQRNEQGYVNDHPLGRGASLTEPSGGYVNKSHPGLGERSAEA